jgi:hypothetical protein
MGPLAAPGGLLRGRALAWPWGGVVRGRGGGPEAWLRGWLVAWAWGARHRRTPNPGWGRPSCWVLDGGTYVAPPPTFTLFILGACISQSWGCLYSALDIYPEPFPPSRRLCNAARPHQRVCCAALYAAALRCVRTIPGSCAHVCQQARCTIVKNAPLSPARLLRIMRTTA